MNTLKDMLLSQPKKKNKWKNQYQNRGPIANIIIIILIIGGIASIYRVVNSKIEKHHSFQFYYEQATRYREDGQFLAIASFEEAVSINPDLSRAHYELGNLYTRQQDYDKAISAYIRFIEINPNHAHGHYNLVRAYALNGDKKLASQSLAKAMSIDSDLIQQPKIGSDLIQQSKDEVLSELIPRRNR
jgi:tetratricopeptide (TPR) repeat protein